MDNAAIPEKIIFRERKVDEKLIPEKSKVRYEKELELFDKWKRDNHVESVCQDVIMAYIDELSEKFTPNSLYTKVSMLKSSLLATKNIDIKKYRKVDSYLRENSVGYIPKKSKILSKEEVLQFLNNASDADYLMEKVVLVFGFFGACRRGEITNMKTVDITDKGSMLVINIPETEHYKKRSFCILENQEPNGVSLYRKYAALRPDNVTHNRVFISCKNGRCTKQVVGKNTIGAIPKKIATFLGLENPHLYTGHCLRRASAAQAVDAGGDIPMLKRLDGWESTAVAQGSNDESMASLSRIPHVIPGPSTDIKVEPQKVIINPSGGSNSTAVAEGSIDESMDSKRDIPRLLAGPSTDIKIEPQEENYNQFDGWESTAVSECSIDESMDFKREIPCLPVNPSTDIKIEPQEEIFNQFGKWESTAVAESSIDKSMDSKREIPHLLAGPSTDIKVEPQEVIFNRSGRSKSAAVAEGSTDENMASKRKIPRLIAGPSTEDNVETQEVTFYQLGGWKSKTVAEGSTDESRAPKRKIRRVKAGSSTDNKLDTNIRKKK